MVSILGFSKPYDRNGCFEDLCEEMNANLLPGIHIPGNFTKTKMIKRKKFETKDYLLQLNIMCHDAKKNTKKNPKTTPRYNIVHWCQLLAFKYFFITLTPAYLNSGHLLSFFSYNEHTSKALLLIIYQIVLRHTLRDFFSRISWWYLYSAHWVPGVVSTLNISALNLFHLFNSDNTVGGGYYYPFYCCWNWGKIF